MREILKNYVFNGNRFEVLVRDNNEFVGIVNGIIKTNFNNASNLQINFKMRAEEFILHYFEVLELNKKQFEYFNGEFYIHDDHSVGNAFEYFLEDVKDVYDEDIQEEKGLKSLDYNSVKDFNYIEEIGYLHFDDLYDLNNISVLNADDKLESFLKDLFSNIELLTLLKDNLSRKTETELIQSFNFEDVHNTIDKNIYSLVSTSCYNYDSVVTLVINISELNNFDVIEYIEKNKILELTEDFFDSDNWEIEPYFYAFLIALYKGSEEAKILESVDY